MRLLFQESADIEVFARDVLGIDLNPAQLRWFRAITKGAAWQAKIALHVAGNQIGKTVGLAILILWATHNKVGVARPSADIEGDHKRWLSTAFQWFHLAPTQQQAYLVLKELRQLVDGTHGIQRRQTKYPAQLVTFLKIEDYEGMQLWNGALVQFRTTDDRAKALQGRRAAGISYDEAAFEDHLKSVVNEVLLMRLVAFGGPLHLVSTPSGVNEFYELVQPIREQGIEIADNTWELGDRRLVWSTVYDNVGYGLTAAGVAQAEEDLDESTRDQQLRGAFLEPSEAFFVPATLVQDAFVDLPDVQSPEAGRQYVAFWDTAAETDPVAVIVLDVTSKPFVGVYFKHLPKPPRVNQLLLDITALHGLYNATSDDAGRRSRCLTGWDATGMGGVMLRQQLANIRPAHPLNFGGPRAKIDMLTNLRAALASKRILLPRSWIRVRSELLNYRLDDKKIKQDCVMTLAGVTELATRGFSGVQSRPFAPSGFVTQRSW